MARRRLPLALVLALGIAATGVAAQLTHASVPGAATVGLGVVDNVETAALYCTGLTDAAGGAGGAVVFLNTSARARHLSVVVASDTGQRATSELRVGAHATATLRPSSLATGHSFGVSALVAGGGVVAQEVLDDHAGVAPCSGAGVTSWYASGLDTTVGSSAQLSFFNPTATAAVVNVSVYAAGGFSAPAPFQGLPIAAHAEVVVNLGTQVVNATNVGVRVRVLRGAVQVAAVQRSGSLGSIDVGAGAPSLSASFARVTTVDNALAQVRLANPGPGSVTVTLHVVLGNFSIPPLSATVAAYSGASIAVTPNSAVPAAGYATVTLEASRPVVATLATGTRAGVALSPARPPSSEVLLADLSGLGFDAATITNTSGAAVSVNLASTDLTTHGVGAGVTVRLGAHASADLLGLDARVTTLSHTSLMVRAARPVIVVTATLPGTPRGVAVVTPLDGG